jgi:hypothetical protein
VKVTSSHVIFLLSLLQLDALHYDCFVLLSRTS